jgi:voltage-gated sodium channel
MTALARRIVDARAFHIFITSVILLAGILVGVETFPSAVAAYGGWLHALDRLVLVIFVLEIGVKMAAEGKRPWNYFRDVYNVFDFTIVAITLLPLGGQYVTVLRLLRLLRVLRLVHALPRLQILVSALLKSIPSMAYVGVFLALLFYVYGVAGVFLFGRNDPLHFGRLDHAMLTLFTVVTLEGWAELMYTQLHGCDPTAGALCSAPQAHPLLAPLYFVTFILFGTMIVLNLFIGVIMNSMQEAAVETQRAEDERLRSSGASAQATLEDDLAELQRAAEQLAARAVALQARQRESSSRANRPVVGGGD